MKKNLVVKVDFVNDRIYHYGKFCYYQHLRLDNIINILTNKICAIVFRDEPKDVADLITISLNENFVWDEIITISQKKENFEKLFLVERLKTFPTELFEICNFIKEETKTLYSQLLPQLIKDLIKGEKNSLKGKFSSLFNLYECC